MGFFERRRMIKAAQERQDRSREYWRLAKQYDSGANRDPLKALRYYEILAETGDEDAQWWVIQAYRRGEFVPKNIAEAIKRCQKTVDECTFDWRFYVCLADMMREEPSGVFKDDVQGVYGQLFEWFDEDEVWDEPELEKAYFRYNGRYLLKRHETDEVLFMAADVAYEDKQYDLVCKLFEHAKSLSAKDWELPEKEQKMYEDAKRKRDEIAGRIVCTSGEEYADLAAKMRQENYYEAAFTYADKAADMGDEYGAMLAAYFYLRGIGVKQDAKKACESMKRFADAGNADACGIVGDAYAMEGGPWGKDEQMAAQYYQRAADGGNGTAANFLGEMYEEGRGVEQDILQAEQWYRKSMEKGNARAAYNLAWIHRKRYIKGQKSADAQSMMEYYEKAIQLDNSDAMTEAGMIYLYGWLGQKQNVKKAEKNLIQAAMKKNVKAQNELVKLYHYKEYEMVNEERAFFWARSAAHMGYAQSQYFYGFLCYNGVACERDTEKGKRWLETAANKGDEQAREAVEFIKANGDW